MAGPEGSVFQDDGRSLGVGIRDLKKRLFLSGVRQRK